MNLWWIYHYIKLYVLVSHISISMYDFAVNVFVYDKAMLIYDRWFLCKLYT